jgi:hypothetical protein
MADASPADADLPMQISRMQISRMQISGRIAR